MPHVPRASFKRTTCVHMTSQSHYLAGLVAHAFLDIDFRGHHTLFEYRITI
jgi:hypothetical protein